MTAPTLVMTGAKSDPFLQAGARALVSILPSARHQTLVGASHSAVVAKPKALAALLTKFSQA